MASVSRAETEVYIVACDHGYPAKVIRNGRVIQDEFPNWYEILRESRVRGFESEESSDEDSSDTGRD